MSAGLEQNAVESTHANEEAMLRDSYDYYMGRLPEALRRIGPPAPRRQFE